MMEQDIRGHVMGLSGAVKMKSEQAAIEHAVALLAQVLVDLNRIASALEHIAGKKV